MSAYGAGLNIAQYLTILIAYLSSCNSTTHTLSREVKHCLLCTGIPARRKE